MINLQIGKPLNIQLPLVYRYMDEEFIDTFFNTGQIRISSFEKFRKHPDEIRGDKSEGSGSISGKSEVDGFTFHLMTKTGENGYMLSTSLFNSQSLKNEFDTKGLFRITEPIKFAAAISNVIPGCSQVFLGYCNYQEYRIIDKIIEGLSVEDFTDDKGSLIIGGAKMNQRIDQMLGNGIDLMFLKTIKHQTQAEFRFIWTINTKHYSMSEYLDIDCKEAVQFCERIA